MAHDYTKQHRQNPNRGDSAPNDELHIDNPPRGIRIERSFDGETVIIIKMTLLVPALFMTIFAILWNGFLFNPIFGIVKAFIIKAGYTAPNWMPSDTFAMISSDTAGGWLPLLGMALFFVPFICAGIGTIGLALFFLFGKCVFRIRDGEGSLFTGVWVFGRTRRFTTRSVKSVGGREETDSEGSKFLAFHIEMNSGRLIRVPHLSPERAAWLTFALKKAMNR